MKCFLLFSLATAALLQMCAMPQPTHTDLSEQQAPPVHYTLRDAGSKRWKTAAKDLMDTYYLTFYQEKGQAYLVWENKFRKSLEFYGWEDDSLTSSIFLREELLKSRCSMRGAYIASMDSVYFMDPMDSKNYKLYLFNRESVLLQTLNSNDSSKKGLDKAMPRIDADKPPIRLGDWLHVAGVPEANPFEPDTFAMGKIEVSIHLKTGEYRYGYHYPPVFKELGNSANFTGFSRCLSADGRLLYSFSLEDSIRLKDDRHREQLFFAGSEHFPLSAVRSSANKAVEAQGSLPDFTGIPYYGGILYDSAQEVYYRMAVHALPNDAVKRGWGDRPISIIILNKKFEKVGETLLPSAKHLSYQWFVGPDGLYIANHYNHRHQANIGELSFTRYQLQADRP
jgi:hypothetical protein